MNKAILLVVWLVFIASVGGTTVATSVNNGGELIDDINDTTGEVDDQVSNATDDVDETTDDAEDQVSETVNDTTDEVDEQVSNATDDVDETTDEVEDQVSETVDDTTDEVDEQVSNATDDVDETTDEVVDQFSETVNDTTDDADETIDEIDDNASETGDTVAGGIDEIEGRVSGWVDNGVDEKDEVADRVSETIYLEYESKTDDEIFDTTGIPQTEKVLIDGIIGDDADDKMEIYYLLDRVLIEVQSPLTERTHSLIEITFVYQHQEVFTIKLEQLVYETLEKGSFILKYSIDYTVDYLIESIDITVENGFNEENRIESGTHGWNVSSSEGSDIVENFFGNVGYEGGYSEIVALETNVILATSIGVSIFAGLSKLISFGINAPICSLSLTVIHSSRIASLFQIFCSLVSLPEKFFGSLFRYRRFNDADPLENDRRRQIFNFIDKSPGMSLSQIETVSEIPLSTIRHHLQILHHENKVISIKYRGQRRIFSAEIENPNLIAALRDQRTKVIIELLDELDEPSNTRIANVLDLDESTISHHLHQLEDEGIVERDRHGRKIVNRLCPTMYEFMKKDPLNDDDTTI